MSKQNTIAAKRLGDGTLVQVLPNGSTKPIEDKTDWARLRAMTDEEVTSAAMSDPDARPMTPEQLRTARRVPRTKTLRRALALTQEEFAARYHIPLGTLRDWEQGRCEPDQPASAYLTVIAHDPEGVKRAFAGKRS
jgi:putative transcriptional regulator